MSIEGQGYFFTIYFPGFVYLCFTRPRYQVSVYRTIGPLVFKKTVYSAGNLKKTFQILVNARMFFFWGGWVGYLTTFDYDRCLSWTPCKPFTITVSFCSNDKVCF